MLERLGARDASGWTLENFADCPVKWLVQNVLRPDELVPDPEQMVRGRYAHSVCSARSSACARRPATAV